MTNMTEELQASRTETDQRRFESLFSSEAYQGLRTIVEKLCPTRENLAERVRAAKSYEELIVKLGYKVELTKQVHVQDCYARLGRAGGIRAVLPYHDIPTHSSFPTLVNFNGTLTTTEKAVVFFNEMFGRFKRQLAGA